MGKRRTNEKDEHSIGRDLVRAALEHAHYQQSRLTELSHQDFPFRDSRRLVKILLSIHKTIIDELALLLRESERVDSDSLSQIVIGATRFGDLLAFLHTSLELLEFSSRTHISQGTVTLLRALMASHGERGRFILVPSYRFNYSYNDVMRHIIGTIRDAFTKTELKVDDEAQSIAVLSYPNVYRENILANCLLGHEIGHFVVEQSQLVNKVMAKIQLKPNLLQAFIDEAKKTKLGPQSTITDFLSEEMLKARLTSHVTLILDSWITELSSDIFAFRILGPVFLFSLMKFLLTLQPLDIISDDHPSARTRLKFLLDQSEQAGFIPELRQVRGPDQRVASQVVAYFEALGKSAEGSIDVQASSLQAILDDAINGIRQNMIAEVDKVVKDYDYQVYSSSRLIQDIFSLYECLTSFVPPCEGTGGKPGNIVSILNAGMAFMIGGRDQYYTHFQAKDIREELEAEEKINQLILKGIELSYLETRLRHEQK